MARPGNRNPRGSRGAGGRSSAGSPRRRVLVVDDAEAIRTYLVHLLEQKGFDVDTAEDGRDALALLEGGAAPDAVLLDIMMPGIDGIETLRRIRAFNIDLPVVMLSVVGRASSIVEAMQLGAVDYLNKPFEEEELDASLAAVFDRPDRQADVYSNTETGDVADPSSVVCLAADGRVWEPRKEIAVLVGLVFVDPAETGNYRELLVDRIFALSEQRPAFGLRPIRVAYAI